MTPSKFDVVQAFLAQVPNAKVHPTLAKEVGMKVIKDQPYAQPPGKSPGDSDFEERQAEKKTPIDTGRVVAEWRKMLAALEPEQAAELRAAMLQELSHEKETEDDPDRNDDGKGLRRVGKSKASIMKEWDAATDPTPEPLDPTPTGISMKINLDDDPQWKRRGGPFTIAKQDDGEPPVHPFQNPPRRVTLSWRKPKITNL